MQTNRYSHSIDLYGFLTYAALNLRITKTKDSIMKHTEMRARAKIMAVNVTIIVHYKLHWTVLAAGIDFLTVAVPVFANIFIRSGIWYLFRFDMCAVFFLVVICKWYGVHLHAVKKMIIRSNLSIPLQIVNENVWIFASN